MKKQGIMDKLCSNHSQIEKKQKLSELVKDLVIYPQLLVNVRVKDKKTAMEDEKVLAEVARVENELGENGRILVRGSGTEPVVRVMVEAATDTICREKVAQVVSVLVELA